MTKFFAGASITAQKMDFKDSTSSEIALDELKIADFIETKLVRNDPENGVISDYAF